MYKLSLFILFAVIGLSMTAQEPEKGARLLVSKQILNKYIVEDMDLIVKYSIFNVGNSAAVNVILSDTSFSNEVFVKAGGNLNVKIPRLAPGTNVSHTVVVKPIKVGFLNFTAAEVSYFSSDDSQEVQSGISSEPGEGYIVAFRDYDKKFSPHLLDWGAFAVMAFAPLFIPIILWSTSKSKYESISSYKKSSRD